MTVETPGGGGGGGQAAGAGSGGRPMGGRSENAAD